MAKRLIPTFNRILVEKIVPPSKTSAGILLPEKSSQVYSFTVFAFLWFYWFISQWFNQPLCCVVSKQLNSGKVVAVGPGSRDKAGNLIPVSVKEGDRVLLPEYGGTQIKLEDKEYVWFWICFLVVCEALSIENLCIAFFFLQVPFV